ncbi:ABC transporter ATP-binding protein [Vagococcus acidifermentans]|uniref:Peptide ABC transporter substrate-binding protein n=1 Tax=Vagococcus acidifermentans TaxID=564710 RepID=A0A430AYW5_9ENTE|nr:dipeptide ABC transporter ATP-binding protein [Vagococcus acidifermentans]RSU13262.1 peptide ABC transporter substrate-binding protein [Vagococcus acidifermentans]
MADETVKTPLLEVADIKKWFPLKTLPFSEKKYIKAVDGISFTLHENETLGVVGESGCGKSTLGRTIMNLLPPSAGKVVFQGKVIQELSPKELREMRQQLQIIFQDPYASLNPRFTVGEIIGEPLAIQGKLTKKEQVQKVKEIMAKVGLNVNYINRYPHEFSGGQRQRIGIARAIILEPSVIVCDEPVSALDVSIQAQVINLLKDLQAEMGLAYIFISHDLSVVRHVSDRVMVMYLGQVMEMADKEDLYHRTLHPYTKALLSAVPVADRHVKKEKLMLKGDLPSPADPPSGCCFHTRCVFAQELCRTQTPELTEYRKNHFCRCHFADKNEGEYHEDYKN